eukprot:CAMPEP_0169104606 /NCGR_PEP_ID=MMETSP1015-20121227/23350_1 /TAXON_ID=342587 /ORGANISM="Karlodinium micrum, Strain CCMP2283" /LENGTH=137 /DNA_ID=CAMNT_0009165905 /DNA_START=66 /DNA_END=479 /DNA_ORIENTATION=+
MPGITAIVVLAFAAMVDAGVLRAKPVAAVDTKPNALTIPQNETMHLRPQNFMEVTLGPFGSAADACDYCFGSFTKEGQPPAGPVAPFCVCMAYPDGANYNMFCATPPSAAKYIAEKKGCRCEAKDMEHLGQTTCKPI